MDDIRALIFDKDGTLFDFQATWSGWAGRVIGRLSAGDAVLAEVLAEAIGFDRAAGRFRAHSVVVAETAETVARELLPHLPDGWRLSDLIRVLDEEAAVAHLEEAVPLVPYMTGLRARGLSLAVVTNDSEAPARAHLESAGILDLMDFVAGYDSGYAPKPQPGQILAALAHMGVSTDQTVMVGDSSHDLLAGRAAGLRTIGVLTGTASRADLAPLADVVLDDIGAIPDWLDGQGARGA